MVGEHLCPDCVHTAASHDEQGCRLVICSCTRPRRLIVSDDALDSEQLRIVIRRPTVYCAHPISGLSFEAVVKYYRDLTTTLSAVGCETLHPMTGKGELRTESKFRTEGYGTAVSSNHAIFNRDRWMVERSDIVLVDLTAAGRVSIGCVFELAWAALLHKHTIVVMEPQTNPHWHAFVLEAATITFDTLDEAILYLEKFCTQEV